MLLEREADTHRIIAIAVWGSRRHEDQEAAYLAHMVVSQEYQSKGYGTRLLDRVIEAAVKAGKRRLQLEVRRVTGRVAFYEAYANRKDIPFTKSDGGEQFSLIFDLRTEASPG